MTPVTQYWRSDFGDRIRVPGWVIAKGLEGNMWEVVRWAQLEHERATRRWIDGKPAIDDAKVIEEKPPKLYLLPSDKKIQPQVDEMVALIDRLNPPRPVRLSWSERLWLSWMWGWMF